MRPMQGMTPFAAPLSIYQWLRHEKLKDLSAREYRLIVKIIQQTVFSLSRKTGDKVYIQPRFYRIAELENLGRVQYYNSEHEHGYSPACYSVKGNDKTPLFFAYAYIAKTRSRLIRLESWFYDEFMRLLIKELTSIQGTIYCNLFDGKAINRRKYFEKKCAYMPANKRLIRDAIKQIAVRPFNRTAVMSYLKSRDINEVTYARVMVDCNAWINIELKGVEPSGSEADIWLYQPDYKILASGRVAELAGGFQGCSREMKDASLQRTGLINYDLKSSQANGLIHQFELFGLDAEWLRSYVSDPEAKKHYAARLGIGVDCWKQILYLVIMGGSTNLLKPGKEGLVPTKFSEILHRELDYDVDSPAAGPPETYNDGLDKKGQDAVAALREELLRELGSLLGPLRKWRGLLKKSYHELGSDYGRKYQGRIQIKNALGISYFVDENTGSKLAARILQGQEAAYIHKLTLLSKDYDFKVVANEHDGVITQGKIPEKVLERVKEEVGIENFELVEKPIL